MLTGARYSEMRLWGRAREPPRPLPPPPRLLPHQQLLSLLQAGLQETHARAQRAFEALPWRLEFSRAVSATQTSSRVAKIRAAGAATASLSRLSNSALMAQALKHERCVGPRADPRVC